MRSRVLKLALLLVMSFAFCAPVFRNMGNMGVSDWDQHVFYHASVVKSVAEYGQMPLWNPWYCGGNVLLANPQVRFPTPFSPLHFAFGPIAALKLEIFLHIFAGLLGLYLIAVKLKGIRVLSLALIPSFYFCFNSFFTLQIVEGHTWILCVFYIPLVYYFYEKHMLDRRGRHALMAGAFLALMVYEGGIYPVPIFILFLAVYSTLSAILKRDLRYMTSAIFIGLIAFLLCAPKLMPTLDFLRHVSRPTSPQESIPFSSLYDIFLARAQALDFSPRFEGQAWGWHEYGCYIGYGLALLGAVACVFVIANSKTRKDGLILTLCLCVFFALFLGNTWRFSPYAVLSSLPVFNQMHVTGRFLIVITFILSLLTLEMMSCLGTSLAGNDDRKRAKLLSVAGAVFILIFIDCALVSWKPLSAAFPVKPESFRTAVEIFGREGFYHIPRLERYHADINSAMYPALLANKGTLRCYEPLKLQSGASIAAPMIKSLNGGAEVKMTKFTPNRVHFEARSKGNPPHIIFNLNYDRNWKTDIDGAEVINFNNLVALRLAEGWEGKGSISYMPASFIAGCLLTLLSLLTAAGLWAYRKNRESHSIL